jgi:hypothetical protein
MNKFRPVIGSPVIAESIKNAYILHDDVTREVIKNFSDRVPTKLAYVEYVIERLDKVDKYPELIQILEKLIKENEPEKVPYAHDPEIESSKVTDLKITCKGENLDWNKIFARCLESIKDNENIAGVDWPFYQILVFENLFAGERLCSEYQDLDIEKFIPIFEKRFNEKYSYLRGKKVLIQHMDEDTRHNNRVMYAWADKNCTPLTERGIHYKETLSQITEASMEDFLTETYGTNPKRIMFKDGYEYILDKQNLYRSKLGEATKKFVEIKKNVSCIEEARAFADKAVGSTLSESVREWWSTLSEYDKIFIQEERHLPNTDWNTLNRDDRKVLIEVYRG